MAVDTEAKRFQMMNFVTGFSLHVEVLWKPDGTIAAVDRAHGLDCYSSGFDEPVAASAYCEEERLLLLVPCE